MFSYVEKTYCVKHKKLTGNKSIQFVKTKNGRTVMKSICIESNHVKTRFVKNQKSMVIKDAANPIKTGIKVGQKISETFFPQTKQNV